MTLNDYIRNNLGLTGTKNMCKEGGCGICIVSVSIENPVTKVREVFAVNSVSKTIILLEMFVLILYYLVFSVDFIMQRLGHYHH